MGENEMVTVTVGGFIIGSAADGKVYIEDEVSGEARLVNAAQLGDALRRLFDEH